MFIEQYSDKIGAFFEINTPPHTLPSFGFVTLLTDKLRNAFLTKNGRLISELAY